MADPVVVLTNGVPTSGSGAITTLGQTLLDGANVTLGVTTGAAITTDAPGTLQQYLRGLAKSVISTGTAGSPSATVLTVQGIDNAKPLPVGGITVVQAASSTITRPGALTYASGQLVANSATVPVNLQFTTLARISGGSGTIIGAQISKTTNSITNAAFRLHLFSVAPTYVAATGDGSLLTATVTSNGGYLGYIDITAMVGLNNAAVGSGAPDNSRGGIPYVAAAQIIYGLLEARGAYAAGAAEVFTITVDALQD